MAYAGARGETAEEMARALHFMLPQDKLHPAFDALDLEIAARRREGIELAVANGFWSQLHHSFLQEYLDLLMRYYGVEGIFWISPDRRTIAGPGSTPG